jgi:hypothetical protein
LYEELGSYIDASLSLQDHGSRFSVIDAVVKELLKLRNESLEFVRSNKQLSLLSLPDVDLTSLRSASLAVVRSSVCVTEALELEGVMDFLEDPAGYKLDELIEIEENELKEIEARIESRSAQISAFSERIRLKEAEFERTERRYEDLRSHVRMESSNDAAMKELKVVYAEYVTKFQNLEFINFEIRKLRAHKLEHTN